MRVDDDAKVRSWTDHLAIQDLIYRYSDAVTRADWDQCASVFAPNAVWESPTLDMKYEGARAFLNMLRQTSLASELLIQTPHSPVIRLLGSGQGEATTTVYELTRGVTVSASALGEPGTAINFEQYGIYFDEVARIDGDWKFTHRLFVPIYFRPDCVTGQVLVARSALARSR